MHLKRSYVVLGVVVFALVAAFLAMQLVKPSVVSTPPSSAITAVQKAGPSWIYPDPKRTPGFPNPDITQTNIDQTICNPEWSTKIIRPPSSYTTKLKREQMQELGLPGATSDYEEDHFISLDLGGNPTDPRNLWPEPYNPSTGARQKDSVENYLHRQVCAGTITLHEAQRAISTDWYEVYLQIHH